MTETIAKQTGAAFKLRKGEKLKVIDPQGEQVSDMVLFNAEDKREKLSSGKTLDFEETILITKGHHLWSNRSRQLMEILEDTNGRNDFLLAPCSPETFQIMYQNPEYHPSCFENLYTNLAQYGIEPDDVPTAFNIFMNVQFAQDGKLSVDPPTSKAGDYVLLEAKMDLIVGLTACSAEQSNNYSFKPIQYEIIPADK
ncbi:urea carboxylase-associated family protein [uncultured Pontibacter sp.]|uniref:urea carboxylase-associated family protein n=1 Tax=uncultured Pontibacter sp. TaxID=453356 RepID=UPI002612C70E|nr:urea carboxylase-associated family protein [uncultured Pontibacter sp.]